MQLDSMRRYCYAQLHLILLIKIAGRHVTFEQRNDM
jgi:hypothetical protein